MPSPQLIAQGIARREAIYEFVRTYQSEHGYSPTMAEIGAAVGLKGLNATRNHLQIMEEEGWIRMTPGVGRSIVLLGKPT